MGSIMMSNTSNSFYPTNQSINSGGASAGAAGLGMSQNSHGGSMMMTKQNTDP